MSQYDSSGWSASLYNKAASFVYASKYASPVLDLLAPVPGEYILDFGCGTGELTKQIQDIVTSDNRPGIVVGLDSSESMIEAAKQNGVSHAYVADIQTLDEVSDTTGTSTARTITALATPSLENTKFDAVFSNAVLHWCKRNPRGVLESARRLLKPTTGRMVAEFGGFLNCIGIRSAIHAVLRTHGHNPDLVDPWYFPSVEQYQKVLESAGFKVLSIDLIPRPTPLPEGLAGWLNLFVRTSFLKHLSDQEAQGLMKEVEEICRPDCWDPQTDTWSMMYTRLRFSAAVN